MKTRHPYTLKDGEVLVLEHITSIGTVLEEDEHRLFYIHLVGGTCLAAKDIEIEVTQYIPHYNRATLETTTEDITYMTTERAKLILALDTI